VSILARCKDYGSLLGLVGVLENWVPSFWLSSQFILLLSKCSKWYSDHVERVPALDFSTHSSLVLLISNLNLSIF
jgi:hypothetical protein